LTGVLRNSKTRNSEKLTEKLPTSELKLKTCGKIKVGENILQLAKPHQKDVLFT
jgi:hypothetical protein